MPAKPLILFFIALIFSFLIRLVSLSDLPNGAYWDELDAGYQAYSLAQTGRDYFGTKFPLFIHSFADYRTPLAIYSIAPLVTLSGLTLTAVRLNSVVWGVLSLASIYVLSNLLFRSRKLYLLKHFSINIGLATLILLSLSPWHYHYSRLGLEPISFATLFTVAIAAFLRGLRRPKFLLVSGLFFGLCLYTYSTAKLFVPLFVLAMFVVYLKAFTLHTLKALLLTIGTLTVVSAPFGFDVLFGKNATRFSQISIFTDPTLKSDVHFTREQSLISAVGELKVGSSPRIVDVLLNNVPQKLLTRFASSYLSGFSLDFLLLSGDSELRHSPGKNSIGQFLLPEGLLLLLGLLVLVSTRVTSLSKKLLLSWLILSPIPAALTRDGSAHASRLIILLPALSLVIGYGFSRLAKHTLLTKLFLLVYGVFAFFFYGHYFTQYRLESAKPFQWGFSNIIAEAKDQAYLYDHVIIDTQKEYTLMAYLFFEKIPPRQFQTQQVQPVTLSDSVSGASFGKLILYSGSRSWVDLSAKLPGSNLVIASSEIPSLPDKSNFPKTISYPDQTPAHDLFKAK